MHSFLLHQTQESHTRTRVKHVQRQFNRQDSRPSAPTFMMSPSRESSTLPNESESVIAPDSSPIINLPTVPGQATDMPNLHNFSGSVSMPTHPMDPPFPCPDASGLDRFENTRTAGSVSSGIVPTRKLDGIALTLDEVQELFNE